MQRSSCRIGASRFTDIVMYSDKEVNGHEEELEVEEEEEEEEDAAMSSPDKWIKHPLKHKWTLWYFKMDRNRDWCENNIVITSFSTVEDFWGLYNHIQKASKLNAGCDYSVFKDGIQPMWEDPQNKQGGRWLINMNKNQRHSDLDNVWLEMLLCLIGEAFDKYGEEICGAVVNIRQKGDKLGVWTKDCSNQDAILQVGRTLRDRLNMPNSCTIGYQAHMDNNSRTGSVVKNRYQV